MPKQKVGPAEKNKQPVFIDEKTKKVSKYNKNLKSKKTRRYSLDELKNIYEEDGEMPNLTELEQKKRSPWVIIIGLLSFFAVLAGAAWTGFFCAVLWSERAKAGRTVINGKVIGAFLVVVGLHSLWNIAASIGGQAGTDAISTVATSLLVVVSLTLLME